MRCLKFYAKKYMKKLHHWHFLIQRGLLLASQESIFNSPRVFFPGISFISGVERVVSGVRGWVYYLGSQNVSGLWLDTAAAPND